MIVTQHQRAVIVAEEEQEQQASSSRPGMKGGGRGAAPAAVVVALTAVIVLLAMVARPTDGAVTCADVSSSLKPCVGYLTGKETAPPAECCAGVKRLRTLPVGTAERRQACECVKQAATKYQGLNADAIRNLPDKCGSPLPFPISLSFDCSTIP